MVGFKGPERFVGEEALSQYARNTANTVTALPALLGATEPPPGASFSMAGGAVTVDYALGEDARTVIAASIASRYVDQHGATGDETTGAPECIMNQCAAYNYGVGETKAFTFELEALATARVSAPPQPTTE